LHQFFVRKPRFHRVEKKLVLEWFGESGGFYHALCRQSCPFFPIQGIPFVVSGDIGELGITN